MLIALIVLLVVTVVVAVVLLSRTTPTRQVSPNDPGEDQKSIVDIGGGGGAG